MFLTMQNIPINQEKNVQNHLTKDKYDKCACTVASKIFIFTEKPDISKYVRPDLLEYFTWLSTCCDI